MKEGELPKTTTKSHGGMNHEKFVRVREVR